MSGTFNPSNTSQAPYSANSGITTTGQFQTIFMTRDPTSNDVNYPIGKWWANTVKGDLWILESLSVISSVTTANWGLFSAQAASVETLTGNSGGAVSATANNINVVGDASTINVVGNPSTSTLTASTTGIIASTYFTSSGNAVPSGGMLNVYGSSGVSTTGSGSTITISATPMTFTPVAHSASPYTVLSSDQFIECTVTAGVITIKLPNTTTTGRVIYIKDLVGDAATNNISVTTVGGSVTIDGSTTYTMATNYEYLALIFNGSTYVVF